MFVKRAARDSGNRPTPKKSASTDKAILSDYEWATTIAAIIIGMSFGAMFLWAAVAL